MDKLKAQMAHILKENDLLKQKCVEHDRYKRRWCLRLNSIPEKEVEDARSVVIDILSQIIPHSTEQLQNTVDTVHRLGKKKKGSKTSSNHHAIWHENCTQHGIENV